MSECATTCVFKGIPTTGLKICTKDMERLNLSYVNSRFIVSFSTDFHCIIANLSLSAWLRPAQIAQQERCLFVTTISEIWGQPQDNEQMVSIVFHVPGSILCEVQSSTKS